LDNEQVAAIIVKAVVETKGTQVPKSELGMKIKMQRMTCWLGGLQSHSIYSPVMRKNTGSSKPIDGLLWSKPRTVSVVL
jgi:hypothetical protein